jgi:ABC-type dipeptide/oligopeptide/nickel transport system permease subunit
MAEQTEVIAPKSTALSGTVAVDPLANVIKTRTYFGMVWRQFKRNRLSLVGLGFVIFMVALALGADLISKYVTHHTYYEQSLRDKFMGINEGGYLLGSDDLGRDTATRLVYGARVSLMVAGLAVATALTIGAFVGIVAGYYGRWADSALMRFVDIILSIPTLFLLLLVASFWRVGPLALALVIASVSWVTLSRLVRGEVLSVKNRDFVDAARVVGVSNRRIMWRHIMPNVLPVMIVWASLTVPTLILIEASLSYLGLGVQPPTASWGNMLTTAQRVWSQSPLLVLLPGIAIYLTVFSINLMGNGLRDALDPRLTD